MKKPSDSIFRLIKSMTRTEKRYFKRFASMHTNSGENKYILIFDAINKMKEYDENALIKKFKGASFVTNFSEIKKYLNTQILKSLRNYHGQSDPFIQLQEMLLEIKLLARKGIFDASLAAIKRARKLAIKYEVFDVLMELDTQQLNLALSTNDHKYIGEYIETKAASQYDSLSRMENIIYYRQFQMSSYLRHVSKGSFRQDNDTPLPEFSDNPLDSFKVKWMYYHAESLKVRKADYLPEIYKNSKTCHELFDLYPQFINVYPRNYIISLNHFVSALRLTRRLEEGLSIIDKGLEFCELAKNEQLLSEFDIFRYQRGLWGNKMLISADNGEEKQAIKSYEHLKKIISLEEDTLHGFLFDLYSLIKVEILLGWHSKALESIFEFNQYKKKGIREDLDVSVRLLAILIHWELKNYTLLENLIISTSQLLRKKERSFEFELLLLSFFKKKALVIKDSDNEKLNLAFSILKEDTLNIFINKPEAESILLFFDFYAWIDSKIENKSMLQVLKERYEKAQQQY
ncbi:MAG: hypothetical protein MK207_02135 [Saprospiraceae bacterium]|nr:hypothetical protein [Saprospiraceae bacterium]